MRVLVLRPGDGAQRTAQRLAALGHEAICAPVIATESSGEPAPSGAFDALIATSAQAFRFAPATALAPFRALPLLCVGARTAEAAREARIASIEIEAADAAQLVGRIKERPAPARFLYLAGRDRKPDVETGLEAAGFEVAPWVVYEARAVEALDPGAASELARGRLDAALHFSRRSADLFCELIAAARLDDAARALLHVAISADAARGLEPLAPPRLRVAALPDEAHMLEQLS